MSNKATLEATVAVNENKIDTLEKGVERIEVKIDKLADQVNEHRAFEKTDTHTKWTLNAILAIVVAIAIKEGIKLADIPLIGMGG